VDTANLSGDDLAILQAVLTRYISEKLNERSINLEKGLYTKYWVRGSSGFLVGGIHSEFSAFDIKMISQYTRDILDLG